MPATVKRRWFATQTAVPGQARTMCTLDRIDYADAFSAPAAADEQRPIRWARAIFEEAPAPVSGLTYLTWKTAGYDLGSRGSPMHVLGWRIRAETDDSILLEVVSDGLHSQIVVLSSASTMTLATFMQYKQARWRHLFKVAKYVHMTDVSYLVARAATAARRAHHGTGIR